MILDIATVISNKCVNPETKRPYPVSIIEKAMKECHIAVKPNKTSKQQALDTIGKLKANLPIERAMMRMKILCPIKASNKIRKFLTKQEQNVKIETEEKDEAWMVTVLLASPGPAAAATSSRAPRAARRARGHPSGPRRGPRWAARRRARTAWRSRSW